MATLHLTRAIKLFQNKDENLESRSETIFDGIPYLHTQFLKNSEATVGTSAVLTIGTKQTNLENRSTIEKIASCPFFVGGRCVMKSIITCSNGQLGIVNG